MRKFYCELNEMIQENMHIQQKHEKKNDYFIKQMLSNQKN